MRRSYRRKRPYNQATQPKVKCLVCGKVTRARPPRGSDGAGWFPWHHKRAIAETPWNALCPGTFSLILETEDE